MCDSTVLPVSNSASAREASTEITSVGLSIFSHVNYRDIRHSKSKGARHSGDQLSK